MDDLGLELADMVGLGQAVDPGGGGGQPDWMAGLAGADRQPGYQMGLPVLAGEQDVLFGGAEVQGAQVGDQVAPDAAGMAEVDFLQPASQFGDSIEECVPLSNTT